MSVWGARRQLFFFFLFLFILAAAAGGALWRFWPRPSCQDGRENQDESGVDCGGVCAAVCPNEALAVKVMWARVMPLGAGVYDVAVLVENQNPDLILVNLPYNLRLVDEDNLFITRVTGVLALAPREQFVIFKTNVDVGRRQPARALFDFTGPPIWQRGRDNPELTVSDQRFTANPPLLQARLVNNSLKPYRGIEIAAVLSDNLRNAFAASLTLVEELAPGETREISFSWPRPFASEPVFFDFYPHAVVRSGDN